MAVKAARADLDGLGLVGPENHNRLLRLRKALFLQAELQYRASEREPKGIRQSHDLQKRNKARGISHLCEGNSASNGKTNLAVPPLLYRRVWLGTA